MRQTIIFSFILFPILAITGCGFVDNKNVSPVLPLAVVADQITSSSLVTPSPVASSSISDSITPPIYNHRPKQPCRLA